MARDLIQVLAQRPACTGSGMYLQSLYRAARKKDINQKVVAAAVAENKYKDLGYINKADFTPVIFRSSQMPGEIFGMSDVMPYASRKYEDMDDKTKKIFGQAFTQKITAAIEKSVNPVIIAHHLWILTAITAEKFTDVPVVGICHGTGLRQLKKNKRFSNQVKKGISQLEKIFALNPGQKEEISTLYDYPADQIVVTGLGYNEKNFSFPTEKDIEIRQAKDVPEIIYVGKLSFSKGVISLLRAGRKINGDFKLTLVGSGQGVEAEKIKRLAAEVTYPVNFRGLLSQEEVGTALRRADIFCLPSFYEGFALVLLEALASGLRVVTSKLPGVAPWLPQEVKKSSAFKMVRLPELKNIDEPVKETLPAYEKRLAVALESQLGQRDSYDYLEEENYRQAIKGLAWPAVFEKILAHI